MVNKLLNEVLKPGEKLLATYKQYYIFYWWQWLLSIVLILLPFFFMYPLFSYRFLGILTFFILILLGITLGLRSIFLYNNNVFLLTDQRIIKNHRSGIFHKTFHAIGFENIMEISYNMKGLFATIFNYGDIEIITKNEGIKYQLKKIKYPHKIQEELEEIVKKYQKQNARPQTEKNQKED